MVELEVDAVVGEEAVQGRDLTMQVGRVNHSQMELEPEQGEELVA